MSQHNSRPPILVVEDDLLIATEITSFLVAAGYQVVGPTGHLGEAIELAATKSIVAALLDISLSDGDQVYPVAEELMAIDIPFAFISARALEEIDPVYRYLPRIAKPVLREVLLSTISDLLSEQAAATETLA